MCILAFIPMGIIEITAISWTLSGEGVTYSRLPVSEWMHLKPCAFADCQLTETHHKDWTVKMCVGWHKDWTVKMCVGVQGLGFVQEGRMTNNPDSRDSRVQRIFLDFDDLTRWSSAQSEDEFKH